MSIGDVQPSSFEFYEGIRILLPGAIVVGAYQAVVATFDLTAPQPKGSTLGAISAALVAGLVLYFVDMPSKAAYYLKDPPDADLSGIRLPDGVGRLNLYFILLDQGIPAGIRARALYMGSMYRIGYEAIHLIAVSAVGVLLTSSWIAANSHAPHSISPAAQGVLFTAAGLQLLPLLSGIYFDYRRTHGSRYQGRDEHKLRDIPKEMGMAGLVAALGLGVALAQLADGSLPRVLAVAGVAVAATMWIYRYFRGYGARNPVGRSCASVMYSLAAVPACLLAAAPAKSATPLTSGLAVGWGAMLLVGHVLLVSRGHEKRLGGSYRTQKTWLKLAFPELKAAIEEGTLVRLTASSPALPQDAGSGDGTRGDEANRGE